MDSNKIIQEALKLETEKCVDRLTKSILLNPIAKCFLQKYQPYHDIIHTFEDAISHIEDIVSKESILDEHMHVNIPNTVIKFKFWVNNVRMFGPNTVEHKIYSAKFAKASTPNEALVERKTYAGLLLGDVNYSYSIITIDKENGINSKSYVSKLENKWAINIPIPIGCKWCTLRDYDNLTQIRSGEDMEGLWGFFIIAGFIKYLIPYYQKPFNMPIIQRNNYDNQLSRCECLYSSGLDYENSYYVIASMIRPKLAHGGRGINQIPIIDFIFSLQMNDPIMNGELIIGRKKSLINAVPIKYLFWAFGCTSDLEMIKYICPDLNDFGLIHTIRQACLEGDAHTKAIHGLIEYSVYKGYLHISDLNQISARYIVGDIILSKQYKEHIRQKAKNDLEIYKLEILRQVDRLLRTKFMPGVGNLIIDNSLYDIPVEELTEEQKRQIIKQEQIRNKAICYELGQIIKELYLIGSNVTPSMDKISLLNRRIRSGQQIEHEFKAFNNARIREIRIGIEDFFKGAKTVDQLTNVKYQSEISKKMEQLCKQLNINQSTSILNSFKGVVTKDRSKMRSNLLTPKNQAFLYAMLREIVISTDQKAAGTGVQWEHRVVHPSHLFFVDPVYSPEAGVQVGRYQQPTLYTYLTTGSNGKQIAEFIKKDKNFMEYAEKIDDKYIIKLNGSTLGYIKEHDPAETLYKSLMQARRDLKIPKDCSITINHFKGLINIWCDEGRLMTIFVNVKKCFEVKDKKITIKKEFKEWLEECSKSEYNISKNGETHSSIDKGLSKGFIDLYDPDMTVHNIVVAQTLADYYEKPWLYSHVALPMHTLSYVTAINPYIENSAAVRGAYSSNHIKQAIGPTFRYPQIKYLNEDNVLLCPEIPLVRTCIYDMFRMNEKPNGQNVVIAFMVYTNNQEDSFIVNRASIEAGLFVIDSYTVVTSECKKQEEVFKIPDDLVIKSGNPESYNRLNPKTCMPKMVGDRFYENDALIAKIVQVDKNNKVMSDRSTLNVKPDACHPREANTREVRVVCKDKIVEENQKYKMVSLAQRRTCICGDKFNSTNAQKGTIGRIYNTDQMPYTKSGLRPDIIFNPPSIFKRITFGQTFEAMLGKIAALTGCPIDATPYSTKRTIDEIDYICEQLGIDKYGYEDLYDPESGRKMGKVFIGNLQMQRQQHLVENKLNIRNGEGDVDRITMLPVKGRKRTGGQSVDRMSIDALMSAGVTHVSQDIHINQGAKMTIAFCKNCNKQFTYMDNDKKCWICSACGRSSEFIVKEVVPAENLINQILTGMHVCFEYKDDL